MGTTQTRRLPGLVGAFHGQHFNPGTSPRTGRAKKTDCGQALGRLRGGLTTKLHAACLDEHTAVALGLSEGKRHDRIPAPDLIAEAELSGKITRVTADRAYDGAPVRQPLLDHGVQLVIPSRGLKFQVQ